MQKVVSIYFDNHSQPGEVSKERKWYQSDAAQHGLTQEHLQEYLDDGWRVQSLSSFGGNRQHTVAGWAIVVLEKPDA